MNTTQLHNGSCVTELQNPNTDKAEVIPHYHNEQCSDISALCTTYSSAQCREKLVNTLPYHTSHNQALNPNTPSMITKLVDRMQKQIAKENIYEMELKAMVSPHFTVILHSLCSTISAFYSDAIALQK